MGKPYDVLEDYASTSNLCFKRKNLSFWVPELQPGAKDAKMLQKPVISPLLFAKNYDDVNGPSYRSYLRNTAPR